MLLIQSPPICGSLPIDSARLPGAASIRQFSSVRTRTRSYSSVWIPRRPISAACHPCPQKTRHITALTSTQRPVSVQCTVQFSNSCPKRFTANTCLGANPWVFDHPPTPDDIEAKDPGEIVPTLKPINNITLVVGQRFCY
jgi:hypothetical protein